MGAGALGFDTLPQVCQFCGRRAAYRVVSLRVHGDYPTSGLAQGSCKASSAWARSSSLRNIFRLGLLGRLRNYPFLLTRSLFMQRSTIRALALHFLGNRDLQGSRFFCLGMHLLGGSLLKLGYALFIWHASIVWINTYLGGSLPFSGKVQILWLAAVSWACSSQVARSVILWIFYLTGALLGCG